MASEINLKFLKDNDPRALVQEMMEAKPEHFIGIYYKDGSYYCVGSGGMSKTQVVGALELLKMEVIWSGVEEDEAE